VKPGDSVVLRYTEGLALMVHSAAATMPTTAPAKE
jgi:hypothetical protein